MIYPGFPFGETEKRYFFAQLLRSVYNKIQTLGHEPCVVQANTGEKALVGLIPLFRDVATLLIR